MGITIQMVKQVLRFADRDFGGFQSRDFQRADVLLRDAVAMMLVFSLCVGLTNCL